MGRESNEAILRALSKVFISESLFVSLLCLRSSEGFRVMMTVTMRMARMAMTMRSSMRVKPLLEVMVRGRGEDLRGDCITQESESPFLTMKNHNESIIS